MEVSKTIYRSLAESHFRYGNIIWGTCGEVLLTKLQKMQNRAARIITKSDYDTDAGPLIDKLGWKTIRELNNNDAAVMMFKIMNNMAPPYLTGIFQPLRELHEIMLRDTNSNLRLPRMPTNMGQRRSPYGADIRAAGVAPTFPKNGFYKLRIFRDSKFFSHASQIQCPSYSRVIQLYT